MRSFLIQCKGWMTTVLNGALILAVFLLVMDVVWGVFTRYVMGEQAKWTEELARFLLIWITLLGGAVAFGTKGHLGVDYFVEKFDPRMRKGMAVIVHGIVLFFAGAIFVFGGWRVATHTLALGQTTAALPIKMGVVYFALPISGVFMILYTLENLVETLNTPATDLPDTTIGEETD